jgi:hypothetical protein
VGVGVLVRVKVSVHMNLGINAHTRTHTFHRSIYHTHTRTCLSDVHFLVIMDYRQDSRNMHRQRHTENERGWRRDSTRKRESQGREGENEQRVHTKVVNILVIVTHLVFIFRGEG